ncbi:DUF397 domain-containing protein [Nocardia terpenica]|uniref:DUF397 domain-containing protein n=1 Tax=Nocardia terpenica TaxID=455432 RepID=UPI0002E36329|nr:DUF397 domain-containing protein [Nocardia terpenica]
MITGDRLEWRKSSYSSNGENCVEVAHCEGAVFVRDSKYVGPLEDRPVIAVSDVDWELFIKSIAASQFDQR